MTVPVPELESRATACAERLRDAEEVLLVSHIDADGLTSAGIAASALTRAEISFETTFAKQLDADELEGVAATDFDTVLFTDFGSGQLDLITEHEERGDFTPIICDHHQPAEAETKFHCNPLLEGINGASELSGAGTTYLLARALGESEVRRTSKASGRDPRAENTDLAALAVVGAVGDMQASDGELAGANATIVEEGVEAGVLDTGTDLALYGTQTRPLPKLLEYTGDIGIPGISNDSNGVLRFLDGLDLDLRDGSEWRCWADLIDEEKQVVANALVRRAVASGVSAEKIDGLIGTTYTLSREQPGTELRD
ncbi:MAG: DHH family phosphoesterase, partial [Euryarchaeota archaeon]|nr:DHH family phosphoesterase [Euryarchaeota archaeon]